MGNFPVNVIYLNEFARSLGKYLQILGETAGPLGRHLTMETFCFPIHEVMEKIPILELFKKCHVNYKTLDD